MIESTFLEKLLEGAEVEWQALETCATIERGRRVVKSDLSPEKKYPVYSGGVTLMGYYENYNQKKETVTIVKYGTAGFVNFIKADFWANDVCYCMKPSPLLNNKYLFYFLKNRQYDIQSLATDAIPAHLPTEAISSYLIPIPCPENPEKSLAIQAEIVRILDTFTELAAELTAELTARTKQYNYYRDQLLVSQEVEAEWMPLGQIGEPRMCKRILKNQTSTEGEIPFYKIGTFGKVPDSFILKELFEDYRERYNYPKIGEVLISASGTIGRSVIFDGEVSYFQDSNIVWIENDECLVLNKYLFYFYQIIKWHIADGGVIKRLYNDNIRKSEILVPYANDPKRSLAEQARIVAILDKFDTLTQSMSEGLPREIELRQKQYEYYRDLLLNFPKPEHQTEEVA